MLAQPACTLGTLSSKFRQGMCVFFVKVFVDFTFSTVLLRVMPWSYQGFYQVFQGFWVWDFGPGMRMYCLHSIISIVIS